MSIILIAEDDALLRNLYGKVARSAGHTPVFAESVEQTLFQLKQLTPDVVLLDMTMEDGTSMPVIEHMKNTDTFTNTRIIVVTGNRQYEKRVMEYGIDYFLSKPVSARALAETIARFIQ
jgi:DNA-binding response OmpR family regulator